MTFDSRRLVFHALCVLEDTAREATRVGRIPPRATVRLALGFLHYSAIRLHGSSRRELYEGFWRELTERSAADTHTANGFGRWQHLNAYLNGMASDAGMPRDHEYDARRRNLSHPRELPEIPCDENMEAAICNRKHQSAKAIQEWLDLHGVVIEGDWTDRPPAQIFPTGKKTPRHGLVVRRAQAGNRPLIAERMEWGFPTTVKGARGQDLVKYVTNARNLASPFWRSSLAKPAQRCLVPFTDFAEPHPEGGQGDDFLPKQAWFCLPDQPVGVFAGLWRQTDRGPAYAFATTEPNELVAPIHPKAMPAILRPTEWDQWLEGTAEEAAALVRPYTGTMRVQFHTPTLSHDGKLVLAAPE